MTPWSLTTKNLIQTSKSNQLIDFSWSLEAPRQLRIRRKGPWVTISPLDVHRANFGLQGYLQFVLMVRRLHLLFRCVGHFFFCGKYRGPQLLWHALRSDLFPVYRTYFSELLNETITSKNQQELHFDQWINLKLHKTSKIFAKNVFYRQSRFSRIFC